MGTIEKARRGQADEENGLRRAQYGLIWLCFRHVFGVPLSLADTIVDNARLD